MAKGLADSDLLFNHLLGFRRFARGNDTLHVSVITRAELCSGRASEERVIRRLLEAMIDIPVDAAVAERAGRIRRTASVPWPDALIAASAIEHRLVLLTRNLRDFAGIKGLRIKPPA